jgi:predicted nucleic acid-binding protein
MESDWAWSSGRSRGAGAPGYLEAVPVEPVTMERQLDLILRVAIELRHPVYDCAYLALAVATDLRVVTADQRFVRAVKRDDVLARHIILLGDLAH